MQQKEWISPWWQAALLPDRWTVCGVDLFSLSLWHTFALENLGNHYLVGGPCDRDDAAALIAVCRLNHADGRTLLASPQFQKKQLATAGSTVLNMPWETVDSECVGYVAQCTRTLSRWQKKGGGGHPSAVPYQWHLLSVLSGNDPARMEAAWNTPYAVARCLYDATAEAHGDTSLMTVESQKMEDDWPDIIAADAKAAIEDVQNDFAREDMPDESAVVRALWDGFEHDAAVKIVRGMAADRKQKRTEGAAA